MNPEYVATCSNGTSNCWKGAIVSCSSPNNLNHWYFQYTSTVFLYSWPVLSNYLYYTNLGLKCLYLIYWLHWKGFLWFIVYYFCTHTQLSPHTTLNIVKVADLNVWIECMVRFIWCWFWEIEHGYLGPLKQPYQCEHHYVWFLSIMFTSIHIKSSFWIWKYLKILQFLHTEF